MAEQRPAGADTGEHLIDVLGLQLAGQLGHHGGLARIPGAQSDGEGIVDKLGVLLHIGNCGGNIRVVFGEHTDQHVAFGCVVHLDGILFGTCQYVETDPITVVVGGKGHQQFS